MGKHFEERRKNVGENIEKTNNNARERTDLKNAYTHLDAIRSLLGSLEDETAEVVDAVDNAGIQEETRLKDEAEQIGREKEEIATSIDDQIAKLNNGFERLNQIKKYGIGLEATNKALSEHREQIRKYQELKRELEESAGDGTEITERGRNDYNGQLSSTEVNDLWKTTIDNVDGIIENYRDALLERGVPDGAWMESILAQHRAAMLEQEGHNLDVASGHSEDTVNRGDAYTYPEDYGKFYDELTNQYRVYNQSHPEDRGVVSGKDLTESFEGLVFYKNVPNGADGFSDRFNSEILLQVAEKQGYNQAPRVVDEEKFDEYVKESGVVGFRTWGRADNPDNPNQYADDFANSENILYNPSSARVYGDGIYLAITTNPHPGEMPTTDAIQNASYDSWMYGGDDYKVQSMMTFDKNTKYIDEDDLNKEFNKLPVNVKRNTYALNANAYAAAKGYDVVVMNTGGETHLIHMRLC